MTNNDYCVVLTTFATMDNIKPLIDSLLSKKLAACVQCCPIESLKLCAGILCCYILKSSDLPLL